MGGVLFYRLDHAIAVSLEVQWNSWNLYNRVTLCHSHLHTMANLKVYMYMFMYMYILASINSLPAKDTCMCPYKMVKSMYFI